MMNLRESFTAGAIGMLAAGLFVSAASAADTDGRMALTAASSKALPISTDDAAALIGLARGTILLVDDLTEIDALSDDLTIQLQIDGRMVTLDLERRSIRAPGYRLLVDRGHGVLEDANPSRVRTYRGSVRGESNSDVRGSLLTDGLHLMIQRGTQPRRWIQPIGDAIGGVDNRLHVLYADGDVLPHDGRCGGPDARAMGDFGDGAFPQSSPISGLELCTAELAADADVEYFQDYGSVTNVENRINSVINVVNNQYESQTAITHEITTIIVRTSNPDPYTTNDAGGLLCQFITEWSNNQQGIQRDVAQLFTGRNLASGTIGIAADIGGTGICSNQGGCSGGQFGTHGSYCLAESDFNGNFSCATDLSAHELGHLWGAFHCNCSNFTMNPFITCANQFTSGTIASITSYRNSRTCLDCIGFPPGNDHCSNAQLLAPNDSDTFLTTDATPPSGVDDVELPAGSPSCQWNGEPDAAHNTVWFRFTAIDSSVLIETCDTTDVDDTIIALYTGNCIGKVELACAEDDCGNRSVLCYDGLSPGDDYLIMIGNPGSWAGSQPGTIELNIVSPCPDIGPVAGACCLADDSCVSPLLPSECGTLSGTFLGASTTCADADCTLVDGACCLDSGFCAVLEPAVCDAANGVFMGLGTICEDIVCAPTSCPGDFDGSGDVGFNDLVSLLATWGPCPGCPQDMDGSGDVGFNDLVTLLASWGPC